MNNTTYNWIVQADIVKINRNSINNISVIKETETFITDNINIEYQQMFDLAYSLLLLKCKTIENSYPNYICIVNSNTIKLPPTRK